MQRGRGESESSAPDVRIRSDFYAKEGMTQIYLNDQLKIVVLVFFCSSLSSTGVKKKKMLSLLCELYKYATQYWFLSFSLEKPLSLHVLKNMLELKRTQV